MSRFAHGLVIGKFYPPHAGHVHLIRTALERCGHVTVQVLHASQESIPGASRRSWLRECFPDAQGLRILSGLDDAPVDYGSDAAWDAHVGIMKELLGEADARDPFPAVDAVFTSEPYGQELSRRFGASEVLVDLDRNRFPVSGTAVRNDVPGCWERLPEPVRAGLARRVVVLGAESTGTTTLSLDLREALCGRGGVWARTAWVREHGREYSGDLQSRQRSQARSVLPSEFPWDEEDFVAIARTQNRLEDEAARLGSPVLVCDTDALATCLWHERYLGSWSGRVAEIAAGMPPRALYLLTSHEGVDFEDDGLRDRPELRPGMTRRFREILASQPVPWRELVGSREERLEEALRLVDADMEQALRFAAPLG